MKQNKQSSISKDNAIKIALEKIKQVEKWDSTEVDIDVLEIEGGFKLIVWKLPKTPGSFREVIITHKGEVDSYHKGK